MQVKRSIYRFEFLVCIVLIAGTASCWLISALVGKAVENHFVHRGQLIPLVTSVVIMKPAWMLFVPTPWLLFAVSAKCRDASLARGMIFTATAAFALILLATVAVLACVLPWLPL